MLRGSQFATLLMAALAMAGTATAGTKTYNGTGSHGSQELTKNLGNGNTVFGGHSVGVATISTDPARREMHGTGPNHGGERIRRQGLLRVPPQRQLRSSGLFQRIRRHGQCHRRQRKGAGCDRERTIHPNVDQGRWRQFFVSTDNHNALEGKAWNETMRITKGMGSFAPPGQ